MVRTVEYARRSVSDGGSVVVVVVVDSATDDDLDDDDEDDDSSQIDGAGGGWNGRYLPAINCLVKTDIADAASPSTCLTACPP